MQGKYVVFLQFVCYNNCEKDVNLKAKRGAGMAFKDIIKSIAGKKISSEEQKDKAIDQILTSADFPIIKASNVDMTKYKKVPLMDIATLGGTFVGLSKATRTIVQTVTTELAAKEQLFVAINPKGVSGFLRQNEFGTVGNIIQTNAQGKQVIAGRMRFKTLDTGVPVKQVNEMTMPFNYMDAVIAAGLVQINRKLDALQAKADEILHFLKLEKQTRQRGNLNMLAEIFDEYKENYRDSQQCLLRAVAVQEIKKEAQQDILFYEEQIAAEIQNQKLIHCSRDAYALLEHAKAELSEYQLACYLYAFSSFMELMLQKKFEIAALVAEKNEEQIKAYMDTYKSVCAEIKQYQQTAIEKRIKNGLSNALNSAGEKMSGNNLLGNSSEAILNLSKRIKENEKKELAMRMKEIYALKMSHGEAFTESIRSIGRLYQQPNGMLMDGENLYIIAE